MKKKGILIGMIIVVVVGGIFVAAKTRNSASKLVVKTSTVKKEDLKAYLSTTAKIQSKYIKDYYGTQAKVTKVRVKVGDAIKKGDVLVEFEAQDLTAAIKQAQIQYENAVLQNQQLVSQNNDIKVQMKDLDEQIAELKKLGDTQSQKLQSLQQQRASLKLVSKEQLQISQNSIDLAKVSLDSAKKNATKAITAIVAERSGVVTSIQAVEGQIGNSMNPMVTVQDTSELQGLLSLGKGDAQKVKIGQEVIISGGTKEYHGIISSMDPIAIQPVGQGIGTPVLGAVIDIKDGDENLTINFDADVEILFQEATSALTVPIEGIKNTRSEKHVFVLRNNILHDVVVSIGVVSDTEVQVLQGLQEGEEIVLNPTATMKEGMKVKSSVEVK